MITQKTKIVWIVCFSLLVLLPSKRSFAGWIEIQNDSGTKMIVQVENCCKKNNSPKSSRFIVLFPGDSNRNPQLCKCKFQKLVLFDKNKNQLYSATIPCSSQEIYLYRIKKDSNNKIVLEQVTRTSKGDQSRKEVSIKQISVQYPESLSK